VLWAAAREASKVAAPLTFGRFFEDYGNCLRASADFARLYVYRDRDMDMNIDIDINITWWARLMGALVPC
jgi:hypothetical protein